MKKFSFTLQSVLKTKKVFEKQKKSEFSEVCAELDALLSQRFLLEGELEESIAAYGKTMRAGITAAQMAWYDQYVDYLNKRIRQLEPVIRTAEGKKEAVREQLVSLVRETDTLEKIEKEQYRVYLGELAKDEEKVLGDIMSYQSTLGPEGQPLGAV